jgi:hypothetical protein
MRRGTQSGRITETPGWARRSLYGTDSGEFERLAFDEGASPD